MRKRDEVLDEDGNALQPPEPGTDAANAIYLLEYARKRGFRLGGTLKVGSIEMQVLDLRQQMQLSSMQKEQYTDLEPGSDMALVLGGSEG